MARGQRRRKERTRNPLDRFTDDEIEYLYKFFVENRSVSDIALSKDPSVFEKKTVWKYTKNKIYSLIWKLRYMVEEEYGRKLKGDTVDSTVAALLKKKMKHATTN